MRLFGVSERLRSAEDEAATARLVAIANRTKATPSLDSSTEASTEAPEPDAATLQ